MKLQGCLTALITPFKGDFLDEAAYRRLLRAQLRAGVSGLVPCGSTGEASALRPDEYRRAIAIAAEEARSRVPVIAGVSANITEKAVDLAKSALDCGADGILLLTPYYNRPTQGGLFLHFKTVAQSVRAPVILYNIPIRSAVNLLPATIAQLAKSCSNIVAVKESSGSMDQASEILSLCPRGFALLSGDDALTLPLIALGATGVVSVVSNIAPGPMARLCDAALRGDWVTARKLHLRLFPLVKALFIESNPIPVKAAAAMLGLCANELRLPLTPISPESKKRLASELSRFGLIRKQRI